MTTENLEKILQHIETYYAVFPGGDIVKARQELNELIAECERLTAALQEIADNAKSEEEAEEELEYCDGKWAREVAQKALGEKQNA